MLYTTAYRERSMAVRLSITMDEDLYRRLKKELPSKGISAFIEKAVRAQMRLDRRTLDNAYRAASRERWRREFIREWRSTDTDA
jgi:Arc/MetJ family transcription regulator